MKAEISGIALFGKKARETVAFYRNLFDWPAKSPAVFFDEIVAGASGVSLIPHPVEDFGDCAAFVIQVDGLAGYASRVSELGGRLLSPPARRAELGDALGCIAEDPAGNRIVMIDYTGGLLPEFTSQPRVVDYPPFDEEIVRAACLIDPRYERVLSADDAGRERWKELANARCWSEYAALRPFLDRLGSPKHVLDIGAGLGRWAAFLARTRGWTGVEYDLYDGEGTTVRYTLNGPRFTDSYCSTFSVLRSILAKNGVEKYRIVDAKTTPLSALTPSYDFISSFWSVGWHWSLDHFIQDLEPLIRGSRLAAFTVPADYVLPRECGLRPQRIEFRDPTGRARHFMIFENEVR